MQLQVYTLEFQCKHSTIQCLHSNYSVNTDNRVFTLGFQCLHLNFSVNTVNRVFTLRFQRKHWIYQCFFDTGTEYILKNDNFWHTVFAFSPCKDVAVFVVAIFVCRSFNVFRCFVWNWTFIQAPVQASRSRMRKTWLSLIFAPCIIRRVFT